MAAAPAPTPIPALAPALNDPLDDSLLLEGTGAEEVESVDEAVGEAFDETVVPVDDESVVCRLGSQSGQPFRRTQHISYFSLALEYTYRSWRRVDNCKGKEMKRGAVCWGPKNCACVC